LLIAILDSNGNWLAGQLNRAAFPVIACHLIRNTLGKIRGGNIAAACQAGGEAVSIASGGDMKDHPQAHSGTYVARLVLTITFLSLTVTAPQTLAQSADAPPRAAAGSVQPQASQTPQSGAQQQPATPDSDLAQMRTDLDRMDSLLGNMSSEIEFLRDQNLQILLRTNAQMWRMLISDLRRQVDREERRSHK
jgi:hypothetical protein